MNVYIFLFVVIFSLVTAADDLYPPSWNDFCNLKEKYNGTNKDLFFVCDVTGLESTIFDFGDLNNYSANVTENVTYSIHVQCSKSANISMRWPIKVARLIDVKVEGCVLDDFINDWSNEDLDDTGDNIQYLQIIDSVALIDTSVLFTSLVNTANISREWSCGHDQTIKKLVKRNFANKFYISDPSILRKLRPDAQHIKLINEMLDLKPNCVFKDLEMLEETYLASTSAYHLSVFSADSKFPSVNNLNFSHNGWPEIPEVLQDWRLRFQNLKYLDLSYNQITDVDMKNRFDQPLDEDTIIDVRYNNITTFTLQDVLNWAKLVSMVVDIRGNPIDCGCFKQDAIFRLQDEDFYVDNLKKYKYLQDMKCATPKSAEGIYLKDVSKVEMGCDIPPEDLTIYLVVLAVVAAILILVIVLIFRYRREIKIILYIRFHILFPWDVDDKKENKKYDAFVSYSSEDEDWVYDFLQQKLEHPSETDTPTFKLCLHQRDFIGGKSILDNIIDSIENSRHTIVILSKNFLRSIWGLEEFKHAYYQSIVKKHRHLIMIKYEDIPENMMDSTLRRCLKTFTYLNIKDRMFTDRLRFALAIKTRKTVSNEKDQKPPSYDLTLPGPLVISDTTPTINTQLSSISDDSGCIADIISEGRSNKALDILDELKSSPV